jgi:FkbM family methyltransferase
LDTGNSSARPTLLIFSRERGPAGEQFDIDKPSWRPLSSPSVQFEIRMVNQIMHIFSRLRLFAIRWFKARRYGISYLGTTRTPFPNKLRIRNQFIPISEPLGNECVFDLFNVLLDDEYGLAKIPTVPAVIVDIGVNMGIFILGAWQHHPQARIFGYEPNPVAFEMAAANLTITGATLFNEAVGRFSGVCSIIDNSQSRLARAVYSDKGTIPVAAISEVLRRAGGRIDFLKIDCEGAEWDILEDHESLRAVLNIRMEYHLVNHRTLENLFSLLASGGHRVVKCAEHGSHGVVWSQRDPSLSV